MAKQKEVEIMILGEEGSNAGVLIDGEFCTHGEVAIVPFSVAQNLIYRERAVLYNSDRAKAKKATKKSENAPEKES